MNKIINICDEVQLHDDATWELLAQSRENHYHNMMSGWVKLFLNDEDYINNRPTVNNKNLIVANGSEFVAQSLIKTNIIESGGYTTKKYYNYKISHFAIGSGGATVSENIVTLVGPKINDKYLYQPISLGNKKYKNEPSKYISVGENPQIHSYLNSVKPIIDPNNKTNSDYGALYLESVKYGDDKLNYYTKILFKCVIPAGEPSILPSNTAINISEAGLYFTDSELTDIQMFSHICFPPKWMEINNTLTILWYIIC